MRRLLVATDFSERSDRAIRRATLMARQFDASLGLVHVIDDDQPRRLVSAEREVAEDLLHHLVATLRDVDDVACTSRILLGEPFEAIAHAAREEDADLVVLGPHRRLALRNVFVGTTAERTIRACDRPVLMANGVPATTYRSAVVAVDFSASSEDALAGVRRLGLDEKLAISALHVFEAPAVGLVRRGASADTSLERYLGDEGQDASAGLDEFVDRQNFAFAQRVLRPVGGSIASTICEVAKDLSMDLIVVGTHGRSGLGKALLGSVAEEVLRFSTCDVLAIPPSGTTRSGQ